LDPHHGLEESGSSATWFYRCLARSLVATHGWPWAIEREWVEGPFHHKRYKRLVNELFVNTKYKDIYILCKL